MAQVKSTPITRKEFDYAHGDVTLKFTLKIDTTNELISFRKCLNKALQDVEEEIKKH